LPSTTGSGDNRRRRRRTEGRMVRRKAVCGERVECKR